MLSRGFFMDQMMDVIRGLRPDFTDADIRALQADLKQQRRRTAATSSAC